MITAQDITRLLRGQGSHNNPSGISCFFVRFNHEWGIKVYYQEDKRDDSYNRQAEAAEYGLGPAVGDVFDVPIGSSTYWCYVTQIADLPVSPYEYIRNGDEDGYWDALDEWAEDYYDDIAFLAVALYEKIAWRFEDTHAGNVGFINGRLVCIDFGDDG